MPNKVWSEITYPFPNFNGCTIEVWEWICNFILYFILDIITNPCWETIHYLRHCWNIVNWMNPPSQTPVKLLIKTKKMHSRKCIGKCCLWNICHFIVAWLWWCCHGKAMTIYWIPYLGSVHGLPPGKLNEYCMWGNIYIESLGHCFIEVLFAGLLGSNHHLCWAVGAISQETKVAWFGKR